MAFTNEDIKARLNEKFGEAYISAYEESYGMLSVTVPASQNLKCLQFLFDEMGFQFLTDICAIHYPERSGEELCLVYHLHNLPDNVRMRLKAYVPVARPDIATATAIFPGANWMERETYDFFGVNFVGHPNLTRIMNVDEMDYFPMRKEYPMEDASRRDKDDEMFGRGGGSFY
ncbi:MAG: NADH-quinone oxidoreductase subunit C [Bacteroidetes bacterium]|nr:NADH-quinone oxidoreductase subunit C [Bacteroidota bacterium]MBS1628740.1 NADH-quinone oxidoreductase subunit C [Bacteroidota bacterium]